MSKGISGESGFKIKGFVEIELVKNNGREHYKYYNALSDAFKAAILTSSVGQFMYGRGRLFGQKALLNPMYYHSSTNYDCFGPTNMTNVLINQNSLSGVPSVVPNALKSSDMSLNVLNVPGYANTRRDAVGNNGINMRDSVDANAVANKTIINKYKYETGVGTGTITHIGMCVGSPDDTKGIRVYRFLDDITIQEGGSFTPSSYICPPGCGGLSANEIFINYTNENGSTHKVNLETGVIDDNPTGYKVIDTSYMSEASDIIIIGDYLYVVNGYYVHVYNKTTCVNVKDIYIGGNQYGKQLFYYDGTSERLFVTSCNRGDTTTPCMTELTKGSYDYYGVKGTDYTDYSELVTLGLGFTVDSTKYTIKSFGSNKVGLCDTLSGNRADYDCNTMLIVDKQPDSNNNLICYDCIPSLFKKASFISYDETNDNYYVFDLWNYARYLIDNTAASITVSPLEYTQYKLDGITANITYNIGWTYSKKSDCCQLLSLAELSEPINKGANDVLYVSYGYEVV